ncbi:MAG: hypothetical protein ACRC1R_10410 [Cetobacterium sp.]|uniref:hypothetical protein n=1 Tax=Cetobacterium sp. TaxID=2071632 RepID=UPI003F3B3454
MKNQNQELIRKEYNHPEDELDLMELLNILIREKRTIVVTFIVVSLLSLGGALYERKNSKRALEIVNVNTDRIKNFKETDLLPLGVLEDIYKTNGIKEKNKITLDRFREEFQIRPLIPQEIIKKREFLAKDGETLDYTPENYEITLRVGSIEESKEILWRYYEDLNRYYGDKYNDEYHFRDISLDILQDKKYSYEDYLNIIENRKNTLISILGNKANENLNYAAYGYGYRDVEIALENLEKIEITEIRNYLRETKIVRNSQEFKDQYISRREYLLGEISILSEEIRGYKNLLDDYEGKEKIAVPQEFKIDEENDKKEAFFVDILDKYKNAQLKIENIKGELKVLEGTYKNLNGATETEENHMEKSLRDIVLKYNGIVSEVNFLENRENLIKNGALIKLASPPEIVGESKAKLILGAGMVVGVFLGIMLAFLKNFLGEFKKYRGTLMVLGIFFLMNIKGYSKDLLVTYTHSQLEKGLNPDETPFNSVVNIKNKFLGEKIGLTEEELKYISIRAVVPDGMYKIVQNRIENGQKYLYVPSQYRVKISIPDKKLEKKVEEAMVNEYPKFYTDYFLNIIKSQSTIDYYREYGTYRGVLGAYRNIMNGYEREIKNRLSSNKSSDILNEYRNINLELERLKMTKYKNVINYLNTNYFVYNKKNAEILAKGNIYRLENALIEVNEKINIYRNILRDYKVPEKKVTVNKEGITIGGGSKLRENQYIAMTEEYMRLLNMKSVYENELKLERELLKNMKEPDDKQREQIKGDLLEIQDSLNNIMKSMKNIELKDYRREYIGSVKVIVE